MLDTVIAALMTIAPYNTEAFFLVRILLFIQLHFNQMISFVLGAFISPTILR